MKHRQPSRGRIRYICQAGTVAALYAALSWLSGAVFPVNGLLQLRISEAMCVLPVFMPAAVPGLTVGCLLANLLSGCMWQDVLIGPIATLLGALGAYWLRQAPAWLLPLPTLLANTLLIPPILAYAYRMDVALPLLYLLVALGEWISAYVLGLLLFYTLKKNKGLF